MEGADRAKGREQWERKPHGKGKRGEERSSGLCQRRDQLQPVQLHMSDNAVEKIKKTLDWFFRNDRTTNTKKMKTQVESWNSGSNTSCVTQTVVFTGLRLYVFICCFRTLAWLAQGHVGGCTAKEKENMAGMKEILIKNVAKHIYTGCSSDRRVF